MFSSLAVPFALPWLDTAPVRSMRYRPWARRSFLAFVGAACVLGWCGGQSPTTVLWHWGSFAFTITNLSLILTLYYFAFFVVVLPLLSRSKTTDAIAGAAPLERDPKVGSE